jgi:hypothetical protein
MIALAMALDAHCDGAVGRGVPVQNLARVRVVVG